MKYLITGAAGFIGFNLASNLLDKSNSLLCIDNLNNYYSINLKKKRLKILSKYKNFNFFKLDLENFKLLNKIDIIELIYALHNSGSINKGTADIKEIAVIFEQVLNIDLGNYYHIFVELKARKTKRTKFLDFLKESLILVLVLNKLVTVFLKKFILTWSSYILLNKNKYLQSLL